LLGFVTAANHADAGQAAARQHLGISLGMLAEPFLGPGEWEPVVAAPESSPSPGADRRSRPPREGTASLQKRAEFRVVSDMKFPSTLSLAFTGILSLTALGRADENLARALTFHASFDAQLDADFSRGEKSCFVRTGKGLVPATTNEEMKLAPEAGRFGKGLHFTKKGVTRPQFNGAGVLGYNDKNWSTTVSVWLRLDPDKDLEPGYCDPVQIVGDDSKKGFIFLEWSKDETPRFFRYAIRPLFHIWNPTNVQWADIPFEKRPMVQIARAPFSREAWTHVAFSVENLNDKSKKQTGRLWLNGKPQGNIEGWDLTFGWNPDSVQLVLGAAYVGHLDDLAVFDRALTDAEVQRVYALKNGIRDLRP
jgi:hypothetical protein